MVSVQAASRPRPQPLARLSHGPMALISRRRGPFRMSEQRDLGAMSATLSWNAEWRCSKCATQTVAWSAYPACSP